MKLIDLLERAPVPPPWSEADNLPWDDPRFSERMLREHLSQDHDRASRREERIERHVDWLHDVVLGGRPGLVVDLACGPGLYTERLAQRGHECLGVDVSPAAIAYARRRVEERGLRCRYVEQDVRRAELPQDVELCLFVHGELNSLRPADAERVLRRARACLGPGGRIVFEVHTFDAVKRLGEGPPTWFSAREGLFSARPHLVLRECFWSGGARAATERYHVVDLETAHVTALSTSTQAYSDEEYRELASSCGFGSVTLEPDALGDPGGAAREGLVALCAAP